MNATGASTPATVTTRKNTATAANPRNGPDDPFQPGWQVVEEVDGADKTERELLAALADAVREWHAEIAEISGAMTGQHFDEETVEAMHVELEAELERIGYGHL
jgi:hypothetical protein